MPARPKLPRKSTRLPKGTNRHDYTAEALADFNRNRWRQYKENSRKRARHRGVRDVTLPLGKEARDILDRERKELALSRAAFITHLLEQLR